jgi:hypothetical protein
LLQAERQGERSGDVMTRSFSTVTPLFSIFGYEEFPINEFSRWLGISSCFKHPISKLKTVDYSFLTLNGIIHTQNSGNGSGGIWGVTQHHQTVRQIVNIY